MPVKGVEEISGSSLPKIGEPAEYSITQWYEETPMEDRVGNKVQWELFRKRNDGQFTTTNIIKRGLTAQFVFKDGAFRREYRLVAYLYHAETDGRSWIAIQPQRGKPVFEKLSFLDSKKKPFTETPKYGQTVFAKIETQNMQTDTLIMYVYGEPLQQGKNRKILYEESICIPSDGTPVLLTIPLRVLKMEKLCSGFSLNNFTVSDEYYITIFHHRKKNGIEQLLPVKHATLQVKGFGWDAPIKEGVSPQVVEVRESEIINVESQYPNVSKCSRCETLTSEELKQVFPGASNNIQKEIVQIFNKYQKIFKVNTCLLKAHFFAQTRQESGNDFDAALTGESGDYSAGDLYLGRVNKKTGKRYWVFSYFKHHKEEAYQYGRTNKQAANQKAIFNRAYAKRNGNGGIESGDGWRYRGRGMSQITGRGNYEEIQTAIEKAFRENGKVCNINFKDGKDVFTVEDAVLAGLADWYKNKMFVPASKGDSDQDVKNVTKIINPGAEGDLVDDRVDNFHKMKKIFQIDKCSNNDSNK